MAKYQNLPKTLAEADERTIKTLILATEQEFKGDLFGYGETNTPFNETYTTPDGMFHWDSVRDLFTYITTLTETNDIRSANAVLYQTLTPVPKYEETVTNATALRSDELKILEERAEAIRIETEKSNQEAKRKTQAFLDQQKELDQERKKAQKLHEALKDKKVFAKIITHEEITDLNETEKATLAELEKMVNSEEGNPQEVFRQLVEEIKSKVPPDTPIEAIKQTAFDAVETLRNDPASSPITQAAYLSGFVSSPVVIQTVTQSKPEEIKEATDTVIKLSDSRKTQLELSKQFFGNAFGDRISKAVFKKQTVEFSEVKTLEFAQEVDLQIVSQANLQHVTEQDQFFNGIKDLGFEQIQGRLKTHLGGIIERKIATLPAGHTLNSDAVKIILGSYGLGTAVEWTAIEGASPLIRFAVYSGYGPLLGAVQSATGVSLGVRVGLTAAQLAARVATQTASTATSIAITGGTMASEAFLGGAGAAAAATTTAAAGATAGSVVPGPGTILGGILGFFAGLLGGKVVGKFIEKHLPTIKKWGGLILGGLAGLIAVPFFGITVAIAVGLGTTALAGALGVGVGGLTVTGVVTSAFGVIGAVASAALAAIGTPILVTLLALPTFIALILFIINSGAYIVPPEPYEAGRSNTPADCLGEAPPIPDAGAVRFSSDRRYAYPVGQFPNPPYNFESPMCYHWDGNKAADLFNDPVPRGPLVAYESGTIAEVVLDNSIGGKYVKLEGASGRYYYYAHLCFPYVEVGDRVTVGQVIGSMDETGTGRVQHLHFAINDPNETLARPDKGPIWFEGGDGNVCPYIDFEEKFGFGICSPVFSCIGS